MFGKCARQWLADRSLKPRTREGYQHLPRRYLEPEFGGLMVSDLTPDLVRRWRAGMPPEHPATLAELDVLVKEMPDHLGALVLLCAWCALRVGEVLELRRSDLDLNRGCVKVTRAVSWVRGQPNVGTPSSAAGTREVSVPPHLVPARREHLEKHVRPDADALLFPAVAARPHRHTFGTTSP